MKRYIFLSLLLLVPALALAAPVLSLNPAPSDTFLVYEDGTFEITVKLAGYAEDTDVDFSIHGPIGGSGETTVVVDSYGYITNENHTFSWDGQLGGDVAPEGEYEAIFAGKDLYGSDTNELVHTFTVNHDRDPAIEDLGVTIDPFSPDGDGKQDTTTVTFALTEDADVTIRVFNASDVEIQKFQNDEAASAGTVNAVWDGKESGGSVVPNGTYTFEVTVSNSAGADKKEVTVEVASVAPVPEPAPTPEPISAPTSQQPEVNPADTNLGDSGVEQAGDTGEGETAGGTGDDASDADEQGSSGTGVIVIVGILILAGLIGISMYKKGKSGGKGGNVETEWKVEEGEK